MPESSEKRKLMNELNDVYDDYRTVGMNQKYYAKRLTRISRFNTWYECILAVGASGTFAGWSIFQDGVGKRTWTIFAGVVAILVVIKPFLQVSRKIRQYSKLRTDYRNLYYDYRMLAREIRREEQFTEEMKNMLRKAEKRYADVAIADDTNPSKRLLLKCQDEVNQEVPVESLWYPQ